MMQVAKKIPFDDPDVLNACRAAYVASNLIIAGLYLYIQVQVNKKKGALLARYSGDLHSTKDFEANLSTSQI